MEIRRYNKVIYWGVLLLCLLVRVYCLSISAGIAPINDEHSYLIKAKVIINEGRYPGSLRPPGYSFFMAASSLFDENNLPVSTRWAQIVLSVFSCAIIMSITRNVFDKETAYISGVLYALYPNLAAFSTLLWSETFFIFLMLVSVALLLRVDERKKIWYIAVCGFMMGLAVLTRTVVLYFSPAIIYCLRSNNKDNFLRRIKPGVVFLSFVVSTILPWTYRNYKIYNRFVPIDTNGGFNFFVGNFPPTAMWDKANKWTSFYLSRTRSFSKNHVERDRLAFLKGLERIRREPGTFVLKFFRQIFCLWTPDSFVLRHIRNGWYGDMSLFRTRIAYPVDNRFFCSGSPCRGGRAYFSAAGADERINHSLDSLLYSCSWDHLRTFSLSSLAHAVFDSIRFLFSR